MDASWLEHGITAEQMQHFNDAGFLVVDNALPPEMVCRLTGVLDRLAAGGFIERRQNYEDRRSIRIHLTEKGRTTGEKVAKLMEEANAEFLQGFNPSEEVALRSLLTKIRR